MSVGTAFFSTRKIFGSSEKGKKSYEKNDPSKHIAHHWRDLGVSGHAAAKASG
jgi:hypothetical protein